MTIRRNADSTFKDEGVLGLVLHAHAARKDRVPGSVRFDLRSTIGFMVRLGSWTQGLKARRIGRTTQPETLELQAAFLWELTSLPETHPLIPWVAEIPPPALKFASSFQRGQLEVLRLIHAAPHALDLASSNPVLLWLFAWTAAERGTQPEEVREVASWKRRRIAKWCGGVESEACVKAIEKFEPPAWAAQLRKVRDTIADPAAIEMSARSADPGIGLDGAYVLRRLPELAQLRAFQAELNDSTRTKSPYFVYATVRDIRRLAELFEQDLEPRIRDCPNGEALQALHDRLIEELYEINPPRLVELQGGAKRFGKRFRKPPVPGIAGIEPILNTAELALEGKAMHHCCAVWADLVLAGISYFYRVKTPERATLQVDLVDGRATIAELKLAFNREPSDATYEFVREWLRVNQKVVPE